MSCVNNIDPITMETIDEIPPQLVIKLKVNNKLRFYNVKSLHTWVKKSQTDPETRTQFSDSQIKKINNIYMKVRYKNIKAKYQDMKIRYRTMYKKVFTFLILVFLFYLNVLR